MQQEATTRKSRAAGRADTQAGVPMSADAVTARLAKLGTLALKQALPALLLELERLRSAELGAEARVGLLQLMKKPVAKAAASLPKPKPGSRTALRTADGGKTLEQRLTGLMIANLRHALYEYDRAQGSRLLDDDANRIWLLQQVFRFFGKQLRYSVDWDRDWPEHTWQDLHDLFVYLVVRGSVALDSTFTVAVFEDEFDAAVEYKRLLLLGLVDEMTHRAGPSKEYFHPMKRWAADSSLVDPDKLLGRRNQIQVVVTEDAPPQLHRSALETSFRGWVLRPPEACIGYITQHRLAHKHHPSRDSA